jgi:dolichol-phosphate mannosyltransferase
VIPALVAAIERGAQVAVASRFAPGGADRLAPARRLNAHGARAAARMALTEARRTTDPLSGYFAVQTASVPLAALAPRGWKILLEILVRGAPRAVADVPYTFAPRRGDRSKLTWRTQIDFLRHLWSLYVASPPSRRFMRFAFSGLGSVALNMLTYALLVLRWRWQPLPAGLVSRHVPMVLSFALAQRWVWSDRASPCGWRRLGRFVAVAEFGTLINLAVIAACQSSRWRIAPWDNLAGIVIAFLLSYLLNDRWTFLAGTEVQTAVDATAGD